MPILSNPVYVSHVDPSDLVFSLSSHRQSYIGLLYTSRSIGDLPLIMTISDTFKNQSERTDFDNQLLGKKFVFKTSVHHVLDPQTISGFQKKVQFMTEKEKGTKNKKGIFAKKDEKSKGIIKNQKELKGN